MKKTRFAALLVAALMLVAAAFIGVYAEEDPAVITAGRHSVLLSEVQAAVDTLIKEYESYIAGAGYTLTAEDYAYIRDAQIKTLAEDCVLKNVVEDKGMDALTEEDEQILKEQAQMTFDQIISSAADYYVSNYGLAAEEAKKAAEQAANEAGYDVDSLYEELAKVYPYNKLIEETVKDATVTEEEINAYYQDNYVAADQESYENNIINYEMAVNYYGTEVAYVPAGYRNVTHILLSNTEDVQAELDAADEKIAAAQEKIDTFAAELGELEVQPEEGTEPTEEQAARRSAEEIQKDIDAAKAELEAANAERAAAEAKVVPALQSKIDEIYAKIEAGEDFAVLIAAYGEDPGMEQEGMMYQVHAQSVVWDPAFRDGAMSIEAVGGVSAPVQSSFGVHIIKYESDVPAGAVALEGEMYETVASEALMAAQDKVLVEAMDAWMAEYDLTINAELVVLPEAAAAEAAE